VASRRADPSADPAARSRPLTIGKAARRSGFSVRALRFYERQGLLPAAGRTPGGFRLYVEADLHRLDFIRQAKALGLTLEQIRQLIVAARERTWILWRRVRNCAGWKSSGESISARMTTWGFPPMRGCGKP